jgi:hypothetical protein
LSPSGARRLDTIFKNSWRSLNWTGTACGTSIDADDHRMPSRPKNPHAPWSTRRTELAFGLVGVLAVLLGLWWLTHRAGSSARTLDAGEPSTERREPGAHGPGADAVVAAALTATERAPRESAAPEAVAAKPATISGRLQLDGYAPYRARVRLRQEGATWEKTVPVDDFGRFYLEDVPAARILLAFEVESMNAEERRLVLPNEHAVEPRAGEVQLVDLDWKTRHVNVHVVTGEDLPRRRSSVEIVGPGYRTRADTNDAGKLRLSLVGSGLFSFRAVLSSGQVGVTEVELEDGEDIDTVVIAPKR